MIPADQYSRPGPTGDYADIRDFHERVGRAIMQVLALSHRIAITSRPDGEPLSTLDDLRQIRDTVADAQDDAAPLLAQVGPQAGNIWAWFRYLIAEESERCVRPSGLAADEPGRWVLQTLPIGADCGTIRYLAHVEYCADQVSNRELINRCRGKTPALFVSLLGDEVEEHSQTMAYHKVVGSYRLRAVSANWHGGVQARFQSPLQVERDSDPGTQRILGDCRHALIHDNALMNCLGVEKTTLGSMRPVYERGADRIVCDAVQLKVIGYVKSPNAPCEVVAPWRMWLQLQDEYGRDAGPPNELSQELA